MSEIDELMSQIPISELASQLGVDDATAQQAVSQALPTLFGGLHANAASPDGAGSLQQALQQHPASLLDGGVNLGDVDPDDGQKILGHIFGSPEQATQQVAAGLHGGAAQAAGIPQGMLAKLLPVLAPIVLSYLTKKMGAAGAKPGATAGAQGGGGLQDLLGAVLGRLGR